MNDESKKKDQLYLYAHAESLEAMAIAATRSCMMTKLLFILASHE
jgi:hypothetical protein